MHERLRLFVVGSLLLAGSTITYAIDSSSGSPSSRIGSAPQPASPAAVLYDQMDSPAASDVTSQDFEAAYDPYDDQAADDFVVPAAGWSVTGVDVDGEYGNGPGPAASFHVYFYANSGTLPGALVASRLAQPFTGTLGDAAITLTPPVALTAGTYWVAVQAREDFVPSGQWFWGNRTPQANSPAAWENPAGGFGFGCTTWGVRSTCVGSAGADQLFRLNGTVMQAWTNEAPVPTDVYGSPTTAAGGRVYSGGGYSFSTGGDVQNFQSWNPDTNVWTALAPLPDLQGGMGSMVYGHNGKIYLFGGENIGASTVSSATRIYDIASNTWSAGAPMPDVRAFMGAGYYNGSIYLAGGYNTGNITPAFDQLWRYDIASNTFDTSLAVVPHAFGGSGSAVINGVLYLAGGRDASDTLLASLYGYNIAGNSWATLANLPSPNNVPAAAVFSGQLWIYGGGNPFLTSIAAAELPAAPDTTATCSAYDPGANSWSTCPSLNVARAFASGTSVRNIPVAVGGYTGSSTTASVEANWSAPAQGWTDVAPLPRDVYGSPTTATEGRVYSGGGYSFTAGGMVQNFQSWNPDTNVWTPLAPLPDLLNLEGSLVYGHNGKIYLFGGEDAVASTVSSATRIYTIATNTWSSGASMPDVRAFMGAGYYNGSIYLAGGYSTGNVTDAQTQLWRYDIASNTFNTSLAAVPAALGGSGNVILNGVLYLAGGRDASNTVVGSLYGYNIAGNSWATLASLPSPDNVPGAAVYSGKLWVYGGGNPFLASDAAAELPAVPEATGTCNAYDPAANSWSACPSLNLARSFVGGTSVRNIPVAVGGFGSSTITEVEAFLPLFTDGFEAGNTLKWSPVVP